MSAQDSWKLFTDDILKAYSKLRKDSGEFEIELQFRTPPRTEGDKKSESSDKFYSEITLKEFSRISDYFKKLPCEETLIQDKIQGNVRESKNLKTNEKIFYHKNRVWESYDSGYGSKTMTPTESGRYFAEELNTRATLSIETLMKSTPVNFEAAIMRIKNRKSYTIPNVGRLDLTIVDQTNFKKNKTYQKYECELEISMETLRSSQLVHLKKFCNIIYRNLLGSLLPYTNTDRKNLYDYVAGLLKLPSPKIQYSLLPEARDLELKDMVYGGLVGNSKTKYAVTHKADGIRRWIIITSSEIWAMMPGSSDLNLIYRFVPVRDSLQRITNRFPFDAGYIFDGELLERQNRTEEPNCIYVFYIFDVVCQNKVDIRKKDYEQRMNYAKLYMKPDDKILNQVIKLKVKSYKPLSGVNLFFMDMTQMFLEQERSRDYKKDGFMFIPMDTPYNPYDDSNPELGKIPKIFERSLVDYSDICKWKPPQKRTIDFLVTIKQIGPTQKEAILENDYTNPQTDIRTQKRFLGTDANPLNHRVDLDHPLLQNIQPRSIVEFYWDTTTQLLIPERIRDDKISPNKYQTALAIWKNIFDGISEETMKGQSFQLMRKYHNRIKRDLYETTDSCRNHKVLLDIGSGRGGDISKWGNYEQVFAVEPNEANREELERRLAVSPMKDKVVIIPTGGEDHETITNIISSKYGEKISCVSLMLSFSFFHGKFREGLRTTLEKNLAVGGKMMIFTINGDLVKEMFQPASGQYQETTLRFLNAITTYNPEDGSLFIDIPDTIVSQQMEVPPKLTELFKEWNNFLPLNLSRADKEKFLNPDEKAFSNMYSSFTLTYMKEPIQEKEIERIVPFLDDWVGISIYPTDYLYLSSILKAVDPVYQENPGMTFRNDYVVQVWESLKKDLSREQLDQCNFPWKPEVLEVFAEKFNLKILYLKDKTKMIFGDSDHKIIVSEQYILARRDQRGYYQTLF
jgi:hypothetical protein